MDKAYISEFSLFIDHYLHDHPGVVTDQRRGWLVFWKLGDTL